MPNAINPTDLFSESFAESIEATVQALENAVSRTENAMNKIKQDAEGLRNITKKNIDPSGAKEVQYLSDQYRYLLKQMGVYRDTIGEITTVQRDQNAILKLQQQYANALEGSYNKMSAEYRLLKISANAMSKEWLEQDKAGKALVARLDELHSAMNDYQKSTGKFTLQVGDYGRAMNGLTLSTQQVLREMPTLANSVSQFFVAISNNVPIFTDNLKRAREEMGSWKAALGAVAKSVFSWQTALLVLLTILPKIAKAIHDKRKAQEEANKTTDKAISLTRELNKVEEAVSSNVAKETTVLKTLYAISQDVNRSHEERARALAIISSKYPEATGNIEAYIAVLEKQAIAEANLAEIGRLSVEQSKIKSKIRAEEAEQNKLFLEEEAAGDKLRKARESSGLLGELSPAVISAVSAYNKVSRAIKDSNDKIQELNNEYKVSQDAIADVRKELNALDLSLKSNSATLSGSAKGVSDYSFELEEALLENLEDSLDKRLLLNDFSHRKELAARQKQQDEILAIINSTDAKITEAQKAEAQKQYDNLTQIIAQEQIAFQRSQQEIINKYIGGFTVDAVNDSVEGDFTSIFDNIRNQIAQAGSGMQEAYQSVVQSISEGNIQEAREESKVFREEAKKKLDAEKELQIGLLQLRRDTGKISEDEYQIEANKVEENYNKALERLNKSPKTRKYSIWTILFGKWKPSSDSAIPYKELEQDKEQVFEGIANNFKTGIEYAKEYISVLQEVAQAAIDSANAQVEAAKSVLDYEMEARANGYANNVEYARKEYEEKLALQEQAIAEQEKLQRIQNAIDTATQVSSLVTATASTLAAFPGPLLPLAIAAISLMWGTFAAAKIKAAQVAGTQTYGEGMGEYLDYGGSHASGNDIDFGTAKNGKRRRVERGEVIGVINKKNVQKYGPSEVLGIIDSLNKGTFEDTYGSAFAGVTLLSGGSSADLGHLESGVDALVKQGEYRETIMGGKRIIQYKNLRRVITNA